MNKNTSTPNPSSEPKLAPPGAGIPLPVRIILKYYVNPFIANKTDWEKSKKRYYKINQKILDEIEGLTEEQLTTRVLVPPQRGLEDSSRYWSIAMTLEHLVIVGTQISNGIIDLTSGRIPSQKADIAVVKPKGKSEGQESVFQFNRLISSDFEELLSKIKDKNSPLTFAHPWFGKFNAKQWFWLLPTHHGIHLEQIKAIKIRLPKN